MAKLGTKQRPAIVRVRTEARAKEIASIFAEHRWQFILGIEPDKPENISDLNRLLKSHQVPKAEKVGGQTASAKAWKSHSRRKSNPPLRSVRTDENRTRPTADTMKVSEEKCEYSLNTNDAKWHTIVSCALSAFFLVKFLTTTSLWYAVLLALPLFYFLGLLYALISNQRVILHGHTITILRRMQEPMTANVADSLYQVVIKKGAMFKFRFRSPTGRRVAEVTPSIYKNGDKLLRQLTSIIDQENIDVDIIKR